MPAGRLLLCAVALGSAVPALPGDIPGNMPRGLPDRPGRAVGVTERGERVVSFAVPGGDESPDRILVEAAPGTTITGFAFSASGALYYAQSDGGVWLLPDGGRPRLLGPGRTPAVSPDARYLAYGYDDGCSGGIALRELATGEEELFPGPCGDEPPIDHVAVDRKADKIAFTRSGAPDVWVFDPADAHPLTGARALPRSGRYSAVSPVWMRSGRLAVGQHAPQQPSRVAVLDLDDGEPEVLAEGIDAASLDADPSGRRLLVSTWDNEPDPNIAVLDDDGTVTEGRRPYGSAEW